MKALGLLCFLQALCLNGRTSKRRPVETSCVPVVRSTALFALFPSWSGGVWNLACVCVRFWRPVEIMLLGKLGIISIRGSGIFLLWHKSRRSGEAAIVIAVSGIFLLWHEARRSGMAVVVTLASGYFAASALRGPDRHSSTKYSLAEIVDFKMHSR